MIKKSLIIKKKLYKIENKKNLSKLEEEEINEYLTELERIFNKKKYYDHDDLDYYGIRDIKTLFGDFDEEDYYKPIKNYSAFDCNYKKYERRGDRNKNSSVKQYLYHIYAIWQIIYDIKK